MQLERLNLRGSRWAHGVLIRVWWVGRKEGRRFCGQDKSLNICELTFLILKVSSPWSVCQHLLEQRLLGIFRV